MAGTITENNISITTPRIIEGDDKDSAIVQGHAVRNSAGTSIFKVYGDGIISDLTIKHGGPINTGSAVALINADTDLLVENCNITSNDSDHGTIYSSAASSLTLIGCELSESIAILGSAAINVVNVPVVISNCVFTGNSSGGSGTIGVGNSSGDLNIYNNTQSN